VRDDYCRAAAAAAAAATAAAAADQRTKIKRDRHDPPRPHRPISRSSDGQSEAAVVDMTTPTAGREALDEYSCF